jgi:peptide chain release factor 1
MPFTDIEKYKIELEELSKLLEDPSKLDNRLLGDMFSRQAALGDIVRLYIDWSNIQRKISEDNELIQSGADLELVEMAQMEIDELKDKSLKLESELRLLTIKPDPNDNKNSILEIRAGTGGDEAAIFANDLFRMYSRYATLQRWQLQILSITTSENNGIKEVIFKLSGKNIYKDLKYESGVHRVQRVPVTESAGRIHTSAASVVVMPEIDDIEIQINQSDLKIDVYRSGGNGGQSVNTTDSAVRITHIPSGIVVTCQDTKEQHKNKASAMSVLRSKLYQIELEKQQSEISDIRKASIKSGDRSDKIKTYNFPQDRLTDHRVKKSWFGLDKILGGEIGDILVETAIEIANEELE